MTSKQREFLDQYRQLKRKLKKDLDLENWLSYFKNQDKLQNTIRTMKT